MRERHHSLRRNLQFRYWYSFVTTLREWYVRRAIIQIIEREFHKIRHILDAGCGEGQHTYWMAKTYPHCQVVGFDSDKGAIQRLSAFVNEAGLKNLITEVGNLEDLCETDMYDLILNGSVLFFVPDDHRVMGNLVSALREGGILVLYSHTRPAYLHWRDREASIKTVIETSTQHFWRDYSVSELTNLIEGSDLEVDRVEITYGWFGSLAYEIFHSFKGKRGFRFLFFLYFILIHPFVLLLMAIDFYSIKQKGNGVLIISHKPFGGYR